MHALRHRLAWLSTLKFKVFAACVCAALAASAITTHFVLETTERHTRGLLLDHDAQATQRNAQRLDGAVRMLHSLLEASAAPAVAAGALDDTPRANTYLAERHALHSVFDSVFVARTDGTLLARLENTQPSKSLPNLADRDYIRRVVATGLPAVSEPIVGRVSGAPLVIHAVPVRSAQGELVGVMGGALRLDSSRFNLMPSAGDESHAVDLLIDEAGTVIAHTDASRVLRNADAEAGFADVYRRWADNGRTIHGEGVAQPAGDRVVSMAGVPSAGWMLVRITPGSEVLRPLAAARNTAWRVAAAVGCVAAMLAGVLGWGLTRPITALRRRAERLLDNDGGGDAPWPRATGEVGALSGVLRHVVEQMRDRAGETQAMLRRLEVVLDNAELGVALSRSGQLEMVSRSFCVMFGRPADELIGRPTRILYPSDEAYDALSARARPSFMASGGFDGECEVQRADGTLFWVHMRGRAIEAGNLGAGTIWIFEDVTESRAHRTRLAWSASHDPLTRLLNRDAFEARVEAERDRAAQAPFCALFIDLDRFKLVNDRAGHAAGDQLLRDLARRFESEVRASDAVARLGGDEFAVLLPACPADQAAAIAEKLRAAVESYALEWEGARHGVGASIGLVHVHGQFASCDAVMRAADAACYAAKRGGRNRVEQHVALAA